MDVWSDQWTGWHISSSNDSQEHRYLPWQLGGRCLVRVCLLIIYSTPNSAFWLFQPPTLFCLSISWYHLPFFFLLFNQSSIFMNQSIWYLYFFTSPAYWNHGMSWLINQYPHKFYKETHQGTCRSVHGYHRWVKFSISFLIVETYVYVFLQYLKVFLLVVCNLHAYIYIYIYIWKKLIYKWVVVCWLNIHIGTLYILSQKWEKWGS